MTDALFSPLPLRSGATLGNRIAKAALEEDMAGDGQLPDQRLPALYRRWAAGGTGLLITGNVMVHAEALTGPAGIVLDDAAPLEPFTEWAAAAKSGGGAVRMQISHPGRQIRANMPGVVWGPSAVGVDLGRHSGRFGRPGAPRAGAALRALRGRPARAPSASLSPVRSGRRPAGGHFRWATGCGSDGRPPSGP
ncbi:hypothetical protein ACIO87_10450 [Streptomyces sp. NPDC087218]|uniref:hypothetical protein n=1 Tax=Streptomyces sp. NPDC087218 TaxID=3365769 RepID=UPI0037F104FD